MGGNSEDVWRLATTQLLDGSRIVYSAGADGSIKVWPVDYHLQNSAQAANMASITLPVVERHSMDPPAEPAASEGEQEEVDEARSVERSEGKEGDSKGRYRWLP